jgi:hypothetical protein
MCDIAHNTTPHFEAYAEGTIFQFEHFFLETLIVTPKSARKFGDQCSG